MLNPDFTKPSAMIVTLVHIALCLGEIIKDLVQQQQESFVQWKRMSISLRHNLSMCCGKTLDQRMNPKVIQDLINCLKWTLLTLCGVGLLILMTVCSDLKSASTPMIYWTNCEFIIKPWKPTSLKGGSGIDA